MLSSFGNSRKRTTRIQCTLAFITLAGVIFRSELAILLATITISILLTRKVSLESVILPTGIISALVGICLSVVVDSFFWQQYPMWPEWKAFLYNTVQGKSADWGTSPWHFHLTNSIPKLLMNPFTFVVCVPLALGAKKTRRFSVDILAPLVAYIAIYSLLPHKEWRFIIYVVPGLTAVAAAGAAWIWSKRRKSLLYAVLNLILLGSTAITFISSMGLLAVSSLNYPGAVALKVLHESAENPQYGVTITYLDNLSCQTGVTRFLQKPFAQLEPDMASEPMWLYLKTDNATVLKNETFWETFSYVLTEDPESIPGHWEVHEDIYGFDGLSYSDGDGFSIIFAAAFHDFLPSPLFHLLLRLQSYQDYIAERGAQFMLVKMTKKISILKRKKKT